MVHHDLDEVQTPTNENAAERRRVFGYLIAGAVTAALILLGGLVFW